KSSLWHLRPLFYPKRSRVLRLFPDRLVCADLFEVAEQIPIERVTCQRRAIADDQELAASAAERDIEPAHVRQKANVAFRDGADQRQDDRLFLAPLETVHAVNLQAGHGQQLAQ